MPKCPHCGQPIRPKRAEQNDVRARLAESICAVTGLRQPTNGSLKSAGTLWWAPIREMCTLADFSHARAYEWMEIAVGRMRRDRLTIASPKSLINVYRAVAGENSRRPEEGNVKSE